MYVHASFPQPPIEMIKRMKKPPPSQQAGSKRRLSGPGMYQVVQCGTAGHNVRSKPNMRGTPVGRLSKRSTIEAVEEVNLKSTVSGPNVIWCANKKITACLFLLSPAEHTE